jgi:predicted kinase
MELLLFCGIQATGKSTFYKTKFFNTHLRISLDLLNTRKKEDALLQTCFDLQQRIVVDNTNPTALDRAKYIELAQKNRYKIIGYFFQSRVKESIGRNALREGKDKINEKGIIATSNKLEIPTFSEGFDELYFVCFENNNLQPQIQSPTSFIITPWQNEI